MKFFMVLGLAVLVALCQAASAQDEQEYYERSLKEEQENKADYGQEADEELQQVPHLIEKEADEEAPEEAEVPPESDEEAPEQAEAATVEDEEVPEPVQVEPEADEEPPEQAEAAGEDNWEDPGKNLRQSRGLCQEKGKSCHGWVRCCGTLFCDPDSVTCVDCIPRGNRCHLFKRRCCGSKCVWGRCK